MPEFRLRHRQQSGPGLSKQHVANVFALKWQLHATASSILFWAHMSCFVLPENGYSLGMPSGLLILLWIPLIPCRYHIPFLSSLDFSLSLCLCA